MMQDDTPFIAIKKLLDNKNLPIEKLRTTHLQAALLACQEVRTQLHSWARVSNEPTEASRAAVELRKQVFTFLDTHSGVTPNELLHQLNSKTPQHISTDAFITIAGLYCRKTVLPRWCIVSGFDHVRKLFCVAYKYFADSIDLVYATEDNRTLQPLFSKTIEHKIFAHIAVKEVVAWFSLDTAPTLKLELRSPVGRAIKIRTSATKHEVLITNKIEVERQRYAPELKVSANAPAKNGPTTYIVSRTDHPWALMDRPSEADDSAEHLYRHGRQTGRNMVFLLDPDSPDWSRLADDDFKLVAFRKDGGEMPAHMRALISTHLESGLSVAKANEHRPRFSTRGVPLIHLGHGVHQHAHPRHYRPHKVDVRCVASQFEEKLLTSAAAGYLSNKEVMITGYPRHEVLKQLEWQPEYILVMPTWRGHLVSTHNPRAALNFCHTWTAAIKVLSREQQGHRKPLDCRFLAHPRLRTVPEIEALLGPNLLEKTHVSFKNIIASSAILVTDYSSVAFDFALAGIPVIYFQPDFEAYRISGHTPQLVFDYQLEGFGPVCQTYDELGRAVSEIAANNYQISPLYQQRITNFFAYDDTNICERVWSSLEALGY